MNKTQSVWTESRLVKLRELWDEKLSISKIGEALGVSRNAIAGKAHRLGLPKRQSPIKPSIKKQVTNSEWNEQELGPKPLRVVLFPAWKRPGHPVCRVAGSAAEIACLLHL